MGGAIPDEQEFTRQLAQQHAQEPHHAVAVEGGRARLQAQPAIQGDATDGRQVIVGQLDPQHRRLAAGRPRPDRQRQQVERRLVYPDERAPGVSQFLGH
jgi:hypothetical protein